MNRYPWWKNLLIGLVMVIGLLVALPNVFGAISVVRLISHSQIEA